ncbi:putative disease resistance protein [Prunus yedoensis var. nudiflora]|uniref:Putative disease resistance protein n=1 Tax=Prunus yedoensis var. nudiflora TaxID=2094558 RepID=A0A314UKU4_PRUYE|nr:putative disease resistance protein [Prunus yedoensis var. nudiflora]
MAEGVVSVVLEGLSKLIIQELKSLGGVGGKVQSAQTQLQIMQGYLKDADTRQGRNEAIRIWVASVRDAAYDLEDVIEIFVLKVASKRKASVLTRFTGIFIKRVNLHQIGSEIKKITTKISQLSSILPSLNLHQTRESGGDTSFQRQQERRIAYPHIVEPHVVGLVGGIEILATHLIKEKGPRVVSIWGMPGLGKTTLAKQVYNHGEVKHHFDCFAWVCISQQCQAREVLEEILTKLISPTNEQRQEIAKLKIDQIAERLWNTQRERKCLVVLDDIWTSDAWSSLQAGFPMNEETESRILLTTRNKEVASYADKNGFLFEPQSLNDDESWELFEKIAMFGTEDTNHKIYEHKKELGTEMLQHCKGLPLAITVLAGLLARKDTIDEWNTVHKNVYAYIRRGTDLGPDYIGEGYEGVSWLLELSYDNLPYYLKQCFLYLAHFPEDYEIPVSTLTKLWMAEGFISSTSVEIMEDVSYMFLSELVGRCMVQVGKHGSSKKIKTCYLHDLMRDLCMLKAKEGNFLRIINYSTVVEIKQTPTGRVRRLAIYLDETVEAYCQGRDENYGHVRSLLYFVSTYCYWNSKVLRSLLRDFTFLRVLKFEGMGVRKHKLPHEIGNLVHLRFLSVKCSVISAVSSSIANLVCLQTLDLRCRNWRVKIPNGNVFSKMEKLRHIYLPLPTRYHHCAREKRERLLFATEAVNLHTVVNICIHASSDLVDFVKLTNLRKLGVITFDRGTKKEKGTNIIFKHLQSLSVNFTSEAVPWNIVLSCPNIYKLRLDGHITELPEDLLCHTNLTKLTLSGFGNLKDNHIKVLEKLPSLRMLFASVGIFPAALVCSKGGFPFLEFLSLDCLMELKEWKVEKGAMPSLCRLHIEHCSDLEAVPDGLQYITTLKELTIKEMHSEFCSRLGEGGEDFYKIQHVQSVIISNPYHQGGEDKMVC